MKLQQLIFNLFALGFLIAAVFLMVQNWQTEVSFEGLDHQQYRISLGLLLLGNGALIAAAMGCRVWAYLLVLGKQQKRTSRELERKDVSHEEASSQVKVLEQKVQTLEKALSEALKK